MGRFVHAADVELFVQEEGPRAWPARGARARHRRVERDLARHDARARRLRLSRDRARHAAVRLFVAPRQRRLRRRGAGAAHPRRARLAAHRARDARRPLVRRAADDAGDVHRAGARRALVLVDAALDLVRGCAGGDVRGCATAVRDTFPPADRPGRSRCASCSACRRCATRSSPARSPTRTSRAGCSRRSWPIARRPSRPSASPCSSSRSCSRDGRAGSASGSRRSPRRAPRRGDRAGALRDAAMPTLVLWGARDAITPMAQGEARTTDPRRALEVLPRVGHIPAIEDGGASTRRCWTFSA